ncbi:PLP-dependent aminotransferase family protein [soil metagenome]
MLVLEKLKVEGESVPIGTGPAGPDFVEGLGSLFAGRVKGMRGAAKRDLSAARSRPDVISLAGGHPDTSIFEEETLERAAFAFARDGATALQYGPSGGLPATREVVVEVMRAERMPTGCENVLVTNGAQQGLELMGKVFLEEGDAVLTEAPTYFGALNAFAAYRPQILPIPMDGRGMRVDAAREAVERAREAGMRVKFVYTIPNFQNPSGVTMAADRRRELLELAREHDLLILEDNPYGMLRFEGEAPPNLMALEGGRPERVIYLGTFSKIFAPGVRLGWMHAHPTILEKARQAKKGADLGPSNLSQVITVAYFRSGEWLGYLDRLKVSYRQRRDAMLDALSEFMPGDVRWSNPEGGFFVWLTLPEGLDATELVPEALERNVVYVPGADFYPEGSVRNGLRLSYSFAGPAQVRRGVQLLAGVIREAEERADARAANPLRVAVSGVGTE